jgi:hypothetical protein
LPCLTAAPAQTGFPFQNESLHYTINYASGLSLGDANFSAHKTSAGWDFTVSIDASVTGFSIKDKYTASMAGGLLLHGIRTRHHPRRPRVRARKPRSIRRSRPRAGRPNFPTTAAIPI